MILLVALLGGIALGLLSFGGLWLTVRMVSSRTHARAGIFVSQAGRLMLLSLGFYAMCWAGPAVVLWGVGGLIIAKWYLVLKLGRSFSNG